jgi:hypothetical protein
MIDVDIYLTEHLQIQKEKEEEEKKKKSWLKYYASHRLTETVNQMSIIGNSDGDVVNGCEAN